MKIKNDITELIGKTPMVRLNRVNDGFAEIVVKLEFFNPGASVKDRLAYALINDGIMKGKINSETTVIEPTSGNTGIGLAMVCAILEIPLIIVMPESMSIERRKIIQAYGAKLVLTPAGEGMSGAVNKARELNKEIINSFMPLQFENAANPDIHRKTTAEEIWEDTGGKIDVFIAGVGTGGTITGVSETLKHKKPDLKSYAVEPESSPVLSGGNKGPHKIQGIGAGFIPEILNQQSYNTVIRVSDQDAMEMTRKLALKEGILCGISSGANVYAAVELSRKTENKGKLIVTMINDTGERYLSSDIF
ncbi:MAG: cysteine synthase A [Bacteroidetes bacterium GWF2_38_335]|nr:MAG: cysteine synthase A [Bacteroidetes bacterium GWF2_38_335]OFY80020.1 MAG: cysteine synthase A [Bacteroidetes bacterium RIFOXYA12_FULL_38_20]HBS85245.1 cysteine synthase A [Bacteroidales bacterium]